MLGRKMYSLKDKHGGDEKTRAVEASLNEKAKGVVKNIHRKSKKRGTGSRTAPAIKNNVVGSDANMKNQKGFVDLLVVALVALVIVGGIFYVTRNHKSAPPVTDNQTQVDQTPAPQGIPGSQLPQTTCQNGWCHTVMTGTLNTSSSTGAVILNPVLGIASSTVSVMIYANSNATTTSLAVGTTTKSRTSSLALTDVSPTLVNVTIASSTPSFFQSGVTVGTPTSGAGTFFIVGVGANQNIGIFSTSTVSGVGSAGYVNLGGIYLASFDYRQIGNQ